MKNILPVKLARFGWRILKLINGHDCFFRPDIALDSIQLGSDYGGWNILPDLLAPDSIIYCAGVGTDISFDRELIQRFGVEVHAFDPTPKSIQWLQNQELPPLFKYYPWGLADYDGEAQFHVPKNPKHISHSIVKSQATTHEAVTVQVRTLSSIMKKLGHNRLDLLKMDIEGSEYSVLKNLLASSLRPTLLLIEFHHRFKSIGSKASRKAVHNLRKEGYKLYSISASGEELCFIRSEH